MKNSNEKKYRAIKQLVEHGDPTSEWKGAGLFNAVMRIVKEDNLDLSSNGIQNLIRESSRF